MKDIDRRDFLKRSGAAAVAMSSMGVITGCKNNAHVSTNIDDSLDNSMTYRTNPTSGDKVSILGYGCMRWPMIKDKEGKDIVDQETVNRLVDHALESGVNFFDSSPVYLQGQSETATGIALKRHPRESYFISTKLSNFSNYTRENSIRMYKQSFVNFQTDYLDYYLLHSIKNLEVFNKRFKENGLIDYLVEERKAGRIRNLGFSFHGNKEGFDELMALHETYHWDFVLIQLNYLDWNHASNKNTNASYLLAELDKRGIPSLVMEPLLGGRLANVPDHIAERLKTQNPQGSIASWAFRFAGSQPGVLSVLSGMTYMERKTFFSRTGSFSVRGHRGKCFWPCRPPRLCAQSCLFTALSVQSLSCVRLFATP